MLCVSDDLAAFRTVQQQVTQPLIRSQTRFFDLRTKDSALESIVALPQKPEEAAKLLGCEHVVELKVLDMRTIVMGLNTDFCLFVKAGSAVYCMKFRERPTTQAVINEVQTLGLQRSPRSSRAMYMQMFESRSPKPKPSKIPLCLLHNNKPLEAADLKELPSCCILELALNMTMEWRVSHRFTLFCDKRYFLRCSTTSSMARIKELFLSVYGHVENTEGLSADSVWFTQENKVITDQLLNKTFAAVLNRCLDGSESSSEDKALLAVATGADAAVIEVFVHFQPQVAICLEVEIKGEKDESKLVSNPVVILSPQASAKNVREEVSKVARQEPISLRIFVGTLKLCSAIDLGKALNAPGCRIYVTPKTKILLTVWVVRCPPGPDSQADDDESYDMPVYSYGFVKTMKRDLSFKLGVPLYQIDLFLQSQPLTDSKSFSENRVKDRDHLQAKVFTNRKEVHVRMPNRRWYDLLVDDCLSMTVSDIKAFARTVDGVDNFHDSEVTAIVHDHVVSDSDALGKILKDSCPVPRLLLVRIENRCFTASCTGKLAVLQSGFGPDGAAVNQHVLAMSDGDSELFYGKIPQS
jgi:hypothetical protein